MSAVTDFQTALTAVSTAISAGNFAVARTQLALARVALAGIPNIGNDGTTVSFREDLAAVTKAVTELENESTGRRNGIQRSNVTNVEPS